MKKLIILSIMFTMLFSANAQNNGSVINQVVIATEASIIIPIGNLSNKFEYGHSYGFWLNFNEESETYISAGVTFIFLQNARKINYEFKANNYLVESNKFGVDIGFRVNRKKYFTNKRHYLNFNSTVGIHYLDYNFPSESKEDKESNKDFLPRNATILVAPEISFIFNNVGLKFQYRYSSFNAIKAFESNFGEHSISVGIVYKQ